MEFVVPKYYDTTKFSNTFDLVRISLEYTFAQELFKSDGTRIFYASKPWAFRARLNKLNQNGAQSTSSLQCPFGAYYQRDNWKMSKQPGVQNTTVALPGIQEEATNYITMRWLTTDLDFDFVAFYDRFDEAQLAYETLTWYRYPSPQFYALDGLTYRGQNIQLPMLVDLQDIRFNQDYKERDWLEQQRIFPVECTVHVTSAILDQVAQNISQLFPAAPEDVIYLADEVIANYAVFKGNPSPTSPAQALDDYAASLNPDPTLNGTFTVGTITDTTLQLNWTYNPLCPPYYQANVKIMDDRGTIFTPLLTAQTLTTTGLTPGSSYTYYIWFYSLNGSITKYTVTAATTPAQTLNLKGMVGLV